MGFLDILALVLLMLSGVVVFYGFIYIHDLPHKIAKEREHPHEEAIHVACWLSLCTLHAMWPIVFTWAVSHKKRPHEAGSADPAAVAAGAPAAAVAAAAPPVLMMNGDLAHRLTVIEERLGKIEAAKK